MTLDPATLAAVRERIEELRRNPPNDNWDMGFNAGLNVARSMIADEIAGTFRNAAADPSLTAAQQAYVEENMRRIAREEADKAVAAHREAELDPFYDPRTGKRAGDDADLTKPPTPPAPAKRVEAWIGEKVMTRFEEGACVGDIYVTHFHGVTDAASAEAFERALMMVDHALGIFVDPVCERARKALAPFLPDAPR